MAFEGEDEPAGWRQLAELRDSTADLRRLRADPPAPLTMPVTIISGTKVGFGEKKWRADLVAAHRVRAEALPRGRHVTADGSSHYVPFTEPPT